MSRIKPQQMLQQGPHKMRLEQHGWMHTCVWKYTSGPMTCPNKIKRLLSVHCTNFSEKAQPCWFSLSASRLRISVVRVAAHDGLGQQWVTDHSFADHPPVPPGLEHFHDDDDTVLQWKRLQGNQHPQIHDRVTWICGFGTRYVEEGQRMSNVTGKANFWDLENSPPRISSRDVLDALAEHGQLSATKRIWP